MKIPAADSKPSFREVKLHKPYNIQLILGNLA